MFLTLKELKFDKLKFGALGLIIFLIIFLVLFITGLANGLANDSGSALKQSNAQTFILEKNSQNRLNRSDLSNTDWNHFQKKYKNNATKLTVSQATIQNSKNSVKKTDITYFVIDPQSFMKPKLQSGSFKDSQIVVSEKLKASGYKIGSQIKDSATGKTFTISGFTNNRSYAHTPVIYLTSKEWQSISLQPGFNSVVINKNIGNQKGYQTTSLKNVISAVPGYSAEQGSLYLMIGFLYLISIFVLAVFFYIITLQKIKNFGTLKALGTKTSYLIKHLVSEMSLISISSIILAVIIIEIIQLNLPVTMPFELSPTVLIATSLIFLIITVISSLLSMIKVIKIDPITAIGGNY